MLTKSTAATPVAAQSTLISPVLLECMAQLKEVHHKLISYYEINKDKGLGDCASEQFVNIDNNLNDVAADLSEFMRLEVLGNTFYAE